MREVISIENAHRLAQIAHVRCGWITRVRWSAQGNVLAVSSAGGVFLYINAFGGAPAYTIDAPDGGVKDVDISRDGQWMATGSADMTVRVYTLTPEPRELVVLHGHTDAVNAVAFHPGGRLLVSGGADRSVRLWDVQAMKPVAVLNGHQDEVTSVTFGLNGNVIVSGSRDGSLRIWDISNETEGTVLGQHQNWVRDVTVNPSATMAASACKDGVIRLWDMYGDAAYAEIYGHFDGADAVAFHPSNKLIATGGRDQLAKVWSVDEVLREGHADSSQALTTLDAHRKPVLSVAFNAAGTLLATGSGDNTVRLWSVQVED